MRSGERGGGGLTKKGRLTINNTGGHPSSGAGGGELNTKSNRLRLAGAVAQKAAAAKILSRVREEVATRNAASMRGA
jgi:hypothetical protein